MKLNYTLLKQTVVYKCTHKVLSSFGIIMGIRNALHLTEVIGKDSRLLDKFEDIL